jgi:hypothetical protein
MNFFRPAVAGLLALADEEQEEKRIHRIRLFHHNPLVLSQSARAGPHSVEVIHPVGA